MRVVDRGAFLALPSGTFFCEGKPWAFGSILIKGENCGSNDWFEYCPAWVEASDTSEDSFDRLEEMRGDPSVSYPLQTSICRNGLFEADALFLVFEAGDLEWLRGMIDEVLKTPLTTTNPA